MPDLLKSNVILGRLSLSHGLPSIRHNLPAPYYTCLCIITKTQLQKILSLADTASTMQCCSTPYEPSCPSTAQPQSAPAYGAQSDLHQYVETDEDALRVLVANGALSLTTSEFSEKVVHVNFKVLKIGAGHVVLQGTKRINDLITTQRLPSAPGHLQTTQ